jgi:hypothetical protein
MPGDGTELGYRFGGRYEGAKRASTKASSEIRRCGYGPAAFRHGVLSCAGPAAELRYRQESGMPSRLLDATIGDHDHVDAVGKWLERGSGPYGCFRPRSRFAFRRHVWRAALKAVYQPDVWEAIHALAGELSAAEWPEESGTTTTVVPGPTARALIIRSASRAAT